MSAGITLATLETRGLLTDRRGDTTVRGVCSDSRRVEPGDLFVALSGGTTDGARFLKGAIDRGAAAIAAREPIEAEVPSAVLCGEPRTTLRELSGEVFAHPTRELTTIGITGTNGKTTTTWIVEEALAALGQRPSLLGTVEARGPGYRDPSALTTPEADAIDRFARRMCDAGATHLVMEVSSHALAQARVDGVTFEVAAFTNLTQDHLDFHGSMDAYLEAKARLFLALSPRHVVINVDDPAGAALVARVRAQRGDAGSILRVSAKGTDAEVRATSVRSERAGMVIEAATPFGSLHVETPMVGAHNVDNLLLAAAVLLVSSGARPGERTAPDLGAVGRALSGARGAPGRLERIADPRDVAIFVDYAHSPDALEKALAALRPLTPGRLVAVFGCGGDRDRGKRPLMGAVVARGADLGIVTSDNPRTEPPEAIIDQIVAGLGAWPVLARLDAHSRGWIRITDRRSAIAAAILTAAPGDTVLIAGKGHEDYQILGTEKIHFDDRDEARTAVALATGSV